MLEFLLYYLLLGCSSGCLMHLFILFTDNNVNFWEGAALVTLWPLCWGYALYHFFVGLYEG
mgnify:CR=1 FL=1|jgi:hypothetical protein